MFDAKIIGVQAIGVVTAFVVAFVGGLIIFNVVKAVMGLRVSAKEEIEGLDIGEHGASAYPEFPSHTEVSLFK